jgi:hypothetical protein
MITNFIILTGATVLNDYSWDQGSPFSSGVLLKSNRSSINPTTSSEYVSGYAPGVRVIFENKCITDFPIGSPNHTVRFDWDFGDYYNIYTNNVSLTCAVPVQHIYTMPGKYNVTLTQIAGINNFFSNDPLYCRGDYDLNWYWNILQSAFATTRLTWDQTACTPLPSAGVGVPKTWINNTDCLQQYCRPWSWYKTKCDFPTKTTWEQTQTGNEFEKRWQFEINDSVCEISDTPYLSLQTVTQQTITKNYIVEVFELPPTASISCVTRPLTGTSPHKVRLSPKTTKAGSFPIDRIDWDFGDGSSIKVVTRQGAAADLTLIKNNEFANDLLDPRNYDIDHTYNRTAEQYSIFYPSITAYSANTGTYDSCSIPIGPVLLPKTDKQVSLLKAKNTLNGTLYALSYGNQCSFVTTNTSVQNVFIPTTFNFPLNPVRDGFGATITYLGNNGSDYPPLLPQTCAAGQEFVTFYYLISETVIETLPEIAITQEDGSYIVVP